MPRASRHWVQRSRPPTDRLGSSSSSDQKTPSVWLQRLTRRIQASARKMCHGHPHYHTCHHTSVKWLYCPEAMFDLETGYETPCSNPIYSTPQLASSECPLQNCLFKQLKGDRWTCCRCGHNANKEGWCVGKINHPFGSWTPRGLEPQNWQTCGHGYCGKCSRDCETHICSRTEVTMTGV
ncbi:uncharacterized protein PG986_003855 [Apiospora aurea]|uniref:Uncharacterized protein n=1 Tax=Apiospora aurea TaxID=335848 RepID=A0ABR1QKX7_9PEZI